MAGRVLAGIVGGVVVLGQPSLEVVRLTDVPSPGRLADEDVNEICPGFTQTPRAGFEPATCRLTAGCSTN